MTGNTWLIKDERVNPYSFYSEVFVYYLIWGFIYNIVCKLEQKYNLFKRLPTEKHIEARTRIVSSINAIILISTSVCYYFNYIEYVDWFKMVPSSSGYALFDITIVTLNYKVFKKYYFALSLHHFMIIVAPLLITQENSRIILYAYMFETTVPILDASWYLYNAKLTKTLLFNTNIVLALPVFFIFRVVSNSYILYVVHKGNIMITLFTLQFLFLNVYWFKCLIQTALKVKSKSK